MLIMTLLSIGLVVKASSDTADYSGSGPALVQLGESVSVVCRVGPFDSVKWHLNDQPVIVRDPAASHSSINSSGSSSDDDDGGFSVRTHKLSHSGGWISHLTVEAASSRHAGQYRCTSFVDNSFLVHVRSADMIRSSGEGGVVVISGSRALVLDCNITDGSALIAAQWFKTGEALQQRTALSNSQRVQVESGRVIIEPASEQDAGNYTCSLTVGSAGTTPVERVISVVTNASARINVRSIDVIEAEDLLVTCAVYGKPTPRVSWTKDGENVETAVHNASERVMLSSWTGADVVVPDAVLSVAMVQRDTGDRGLYCCLASNAANTARQCVMVRVRARYACVWPLAGIVIEALLLAAIIYGCDRHSTSSAASGDDKNSAKGEIRQRK